jgi:hypothetical protein
VLGIMQFHDLAIAHIPDEMRDALLLKGLSVFLPSPEDTGAQFGVRIGGDVGRLVSMPTRSRKPRMSPACVCGSYPDSGASDCPWLAA